MFSPQKSNYSTEAEESCLHTRVPPEQTEGIEHLSASQRLPQHVAVIMDGNSRWAAQAGLPAALGHQRGVDALRDTVRCCRKWGIKCLTVYAFSAENWQRHPSEISFLLSLMEQVLRQELPSLQKEGVRLRFIGELTMLPRSLQTEIHRAERETGDNFELHLTVAMSYSGRQDITAAVQEIALLISQSKLRPVDVTPSLIASYLSTRQLPEALQEPDLIIRTSGEQRLSNFLLWEAAYSELYFADVLWPDFGEKQFAAALQDYASRERRYGRR